MSGETQFFIRLALIFTHLLLFHTPPASSLVVFSSEQRHEFPAHYSTLGPFQYHPQKYNLTLFNSTDLTSSCKFPDNAKNQFKNHSLLVLVGALPQIPACCSDVSGMHPAIARLAQKDGFTGVIIQSDEPFFEGRILGFDSEITIPFLVVHSDAIKFIASKVGTISGLELHGISENDAGKLHAIRRAYFSGRILGSILYGSMIFIVGFVLYKEILHSRKARKMMWQSTTLKALAFLIAICSFMWLTIDPFGFFGLWFPSAVFKSVVICSYASIFMFMLQLWTQSTGNVCALNSRTVSIIIYLLSVSSIIISLLQGALWFIKPLLIVNKAFFILVIIFCGIGFILAGKKMLHIIRHSNNMSPEQTKLAKKITSFIMLYFVFACTASVIWILNLLGNIFSVQVAHFLAGIGLWCTFAILFLPAAIKRKHVINVDRRTTLENLKFPLKDSILSVTPLTP